MDAWYAYIIRINLGTSEGRCHDTHTALEYVTQTNSAFDATSSGVIIFTVLYSRITYLWISTGKVSVSTMHALSRIIFHIVITISNNGSCRNSLANWVCIIPLKSVLTFSAFKWIIEGITPIINLSRKYYTFIIL